jgi:DDE superfamily endonuclease
MAITKDALEKVVADTLRFPENRRWSDKTLDRKIRAHFGAPASVITDLWNRLEGNIEVSSQPKHLLWSLVFLKTYSSSEDVLCTIVGHPDPKTFRTWSWYFVEKIADQIDQVITLDSRFDGYTGTTHCLMSVDGTDCPVMETWPFDKTMYSKKLNGPGVKYEVGVSITNGLIVWVNGPFKASVSDLTIFNEKLDTLLCDDEGVEVDGVYGGNRRFKAPDVRSSRQEGKQKSRVRGRHENINGRLKIFQLLNIPFRHGNPREKMMEKHGICFKAIAVLTQLKLMAGEALYDVEYDIRYD